MANEFVIHYPTGSTLYVLLSDATGQIYNGSTFEAPASANWTTYGIAMTEAATATGIYRASMPAVAAGAYGWVVRKQAGGSPAVSDIVVGAGSIRWTGTAEEAVPADVNVVSSLGSPLSNRLMEVTDPVIAHVRGVRPTGGSALDFPVTTASGVSGSTLTLLAPVSINVTGWRCLVLSGALQYYMATVVTVTSSTQLEMNDVLPSISYGTPVMLLPAAGIGATIDGQDVADAMLLAPTGVAAAGSVMDYLADIVEDTGTSLPALIAAGVGSGSGTGYYSDTVESPIGTPVDGVRVQLYTAQNRVGLAYEAYTNASGVFEMWPDPGTYRVWFDLAGHSFPEDVLTEVTEP